MGAIPDYATYKAARENSTFILDVPIVDFAPTLARVNSLWVNQGGAAPTTAAVPSRTIAGAVGQDNPNSGTQRWLVKPAASMRANGVVVLCDRLSHQGGLSGTTVGAQTTNLPTSALTRDTGGLGVQIGLEIHTQIGATATTVTASYTNDAGTAGRATPLLAIGNTNNREGGRFIQLPLQAGDRGVKSVENVALTASTLTAGAFGVVLYRQIIAMRFCGMENHDPDALLERGHIAEIPTDACLFWLLQIPALYSSTGGVQVSFGLDER